MSDVTPDEILMAAYQAGNEAAFAELFERHAGRVYGFLVRRLGDRALAEDVYQETFLKLHRARNTYDSRRPFRAWLFGIVHHLLTDTLRRRRRMPATTSVEDVIERRGDDRSPERIVAAREETAVLQRAMGALSSDEATVLILARFEGLSYDDIATILGRSAAATRQLAYRALKRVRAEMTTSGCKEES
ncbi:MAG: RNA polymerase sigma factor [Candidatus Binatia bacterium]